MIDSEFHVQINGVKYRLAEDGEGEHYVQQSVPLRAPNTQLVQGKSGEFNVRSDLLLWSWSDWSGGEGQLVFDPQNPNRAFVLENVSPFASPGQLKMGYNVSQTIDAVLADYTNTYDHAWLLPLGRFGATDRLVVAGDDSYRRIDVSVPEQWDTAVTLTSRDQDVAFMVGDGHYFHEDGSPHELYDNTPTLINNQYGGSGAATYAKAVGLGNYAYIYLPLEGEVYELDVSTTNTTTPETPVYEDGTLVADNLGLYPVSSSGGYSVVAGDNRVYVMTPQAQRTIIHEIVPSSAAGTGYGRVYATLEGVEGEGMWWHSGYLYVMTATGPFGARSKREIIYIDPNGAYGTLGAIRSADDGHPTGTEGDQFTIAARFTQMAFALCAGYTDERTNATDKLSIFEIDAVTGGFAKVATLSSALPDSGVHVHDSLVAWNGKYWVATRVKYPGSGDQSVFVIDPRDVSDDDGIAISPKVNFGLAGDKVLEAIEVRCETVPAGATIDVYYSLDEGAWVSAGSVAAGEVGDKFSIDSTPTAATFRSMQVKVVLNTPGSVQITLDEINVFASTDVSTRRWQLLLDVSDETSPRGFSGARLLDNLLSIGDNEPVTFIDGYTDRTRGQGNTTVDVVVEEMNIALDRPGEGLVQIILREVL